MNISSYTFQSPYPTQIQVGRPDPSAQQQAQQSEAVDTFSEVTDRPTQQGSAAFLAQNQSGASVNVASASTDNGVSSALDSFSATNNQIQAAEAYSS